MNKKIAIGLVVLVVLVAGGYFGYKQYAKSPSAQKAKAEKEVKGTVEAVSKLITLPEGDNPQVAIVTDLKPLEGQPFFRNASIGDRVIVYPSIGRAILYNPKQNKIIEIATLQAPTGKNQTAAVGQSQSLPNPATTEKASTTKK